MPSTMVLIISIRPMVITVGTARSSSVRHLKDGYREKVRIATKLPVPEVKTSADFDRLLNEQLKRLQTDRIDFYLLHGLNKVGWPKVRNLGFCKVGGTCDGRRPHWLFRVLFPRYL